MIFRIPAARRGQEQVEEPVADALAGAGFDLLALLLADHAGGDVHQVAHHALHVPTVVADLGVLGGLHLEKGSADQLGEAAGDLGLADAGRADEDDILGGHVLAQLRRQLLATPAIADRHRHRALGRVLADDVAVQLLDDPARVRCSATMNPPGV